eukprot:scaffold579485_cov15-Prasinocladus_malaysianus.AAC.1
MASEKHEQLKTEALKAAPAPFGCTEVVLNFIFLYQISHPSRPVALARMSLRKPQANRFLQVL